MENEDNRNRRVLETLENVAVTYERVIDETVHEEIAKEEVVNDNAVIYEEVIEEYVYDDMIMFEGGIEEAIAAKVMNADATNADADAMNAVAMNADAMNSDAMNSDAMNADATDVGAEAMDREVANLIADAKYAEAMRAAATEFLIAEALKSKDTPDKSSIYETASDESMTDVESATMVDYDLSSTNDEFIFKMLSPNNDAYNAKCLKVGIIETWAACRTNILQQLCKEGEEFLQLSERLKELHEELAEQNLEIDEDDFLKFKIEYMAKNGFSDDESEPAKLQEIKSQTPERQGNQTKCIQTASTSTAFKRMPTIAEILRKFAANEDGRVTIGPNGTTIAKDALRNINWTLSGPALTRKILMEVFDRDTLAFHTLTGKPSPAFIDCDKPMKNQLDPLKVADIMYLVTELTQVSPKDVRNAITTKCADENKMYRQRENRRISAALKLQNIQQRVAKNETVSANVSADV